MAANWWKVFINEPGGKRKMLRKETVGEAVNTAKEYRAQGFEVDVVSAVKGFAPTQKAGARPTSKHYWCPYCVKYRVFRFMSVVKDGFRGPEDLRCPVCHISDHDYNVRKYNHLFEHVDLEAAYKADGAFKRS